MVFVVNLKELTIPYLEKLAAECEIELNKKLKADKIRQIKNGGIQEEKLEDLFKKYIELQNASKKSKGKGKGKGKARSQISILEDRVGVLEEQIKHILSKFNEKEQESTIKKNIKISKQDFRVIPEESNDLRKIKSIIVSRVMPGNSMSIDDLLKIKALQEFSLSLIEKAINDFIDEGVVDASEGMSLQKMGGKIGSLTRK